MVGNVFMKVAPKAVAKLGPAAFVELVGAAGLVGGVTSLALDKGVDLAKKKCTELGEKKKAELEAKKAAALAQIKETTEEVTIQEEVVEEKKTSNKKHK